MAGLDTDLAVLTNAHKHEYAAQQRAAKAKAKEKAPKGPLPPEKSENKYKRGEVKHIPGVLENPLNPDTFQLNKSTINTYETVLFREYKVYQKIFEGNPTLFDQLKPLMAKLQLGQTLTDPEKAWIASQNITVPGLQFYADFNQGVGGLEKDEDIMRQAGDYLKRSDRLLRAHQIAIKQLEAMQKAANADISDIELVNNKRGRFVEDEYIFDEQGRPVSLEELKKRHWFPVRWIQNSIPGNKEGELRRRVNRRDKAVKENQKLDKNLFYSGVRFVKAENRKVVPVKSTDITLQAQNDSTNAAYNLYANTLLGIQAGNPQLELRGAEQMGKYAKQMSDIIHARVDLYQATLSATGMERQRINTRVWNVTATGNTLNFGLAGQEPIFKIEQANPGALDNQINNLQEQVSKKTIEDLKKQKEERTKKEKEKFLGKHVDQWKEELSTPSQKEIDDDKKQKETLINGKKKIDQEHDKAKAVDDAKKKQEERVQQLKEVQARTGLTEAEIKTYIDARDERNKQNKEKNKYTTERDRLIAEEKDFLEMANKSPIFNKVNPTTGQPIPEPNPTYINNALITRNRINTLNLTNITDADNLIEAENQKIEAVKTTHKDVNLQDSDLDQAADLFSSIETAKVEQQRSENDLTQFRADNKITTQKSTDELQSELERIQKQIETVGSDRIQTGVVEMLDTFRPIITDESGRNERLQQHMAGQLEDIPNLPHLAAYPRVYLRTLHILFPGVSFEPQAEPQLKSFMRLFPPEEFVRLAASANKSGSGPKITVANMHDPVWNTYQNEFMKLIDKDFVNAVVDDLESKVRNKTLRMIQAEKDKFKVLSDFRTKYALTDTDRTIIENNPPMLAGIRSSALAAQNYLYYYENAQDLAYRIMVIGNWPFNDTALIKQALYAAEEIIRLRNENPKI